MKKKRKSEKTDQNSQQKKLISEVTDPDHSDLTNVIIDENPDDLDTFLFNLDSSERSKVISYIKEKMSYLRNLENENKKLLDMYYRRYANMLLSSYSERNEEEYKKTLKELFSQEVSIIKDIFSYARVYLEIYPDQSMTDQYEWCLHKLFLGFIVLPSGTLSEKDEEEFLQGLSKKDVEGILVRELGAQMLHVLVSFNHLSGVKGVLEKYYNEKQIIEIFNDDERNIFDYIVDAKPQTKIISLVCQKLGAALASDHERKTKIDTRREKINKELAFRNEEEYWEQSLAVNWQELATNAQVSSTTFFHYGN